MTLSTSAVAVCCWRRFPKFVEQPHILDGDHRLVGKVSTSSICLSVNGLTIVA